MASVADLEARQEELRTSIKEIDAEYAGEAFPDDVKERWNSLNEELEEVGATIKELEGRRARLEDLEADPARVENEAKFRGRGKRAVSHVPEDPTRIEEYRNSTTSMDDLEQAYRDGAMQIVERMTPAFRHISKEDQQSNVARLLDTIDNRRAEDGPRSIARRIIMTSGKAYAKEFGQYLATGVVGQEMLRAASLTTTAGGFAVPVVLDPTVILTNAGVNNPVRPLARNIQIVGNTWEGVSSLGITAAYSAEATEASDNAPTLVQPTANVEKAQAFVPFSIEIGEDWQGFASEIAMMMADAKDRLESSKFLSGAGHTSSVPEGLHVGATATISTAATATFAIGDLYALYEAVSPRWRSRGTFVANATYLDKIRQFDTSGGAGLWVQLQNGFPSQVLGRPIQEWSDMSSAATSGAWVMTFGDFSQFAIIDRVGMSVDLVPHLFGTANNYPTGQRGFYAYWRNTSKVLTPGLQANSAFVTLKLL